MAAKSLGVTRQPIHNVIAGRSVISREMALRIEKGFGRSADTWLRMRLDCDLAQVRAWTKSINVARLVAAAQGNVGWIRLCGASPNFIVIVISFIFFTTNGNIVVSLPAKCSLTPTDFELYY
jgi:addiction module HigA family antidote